LLKKIADFFYGLTQMSLSQIRRKLLPLTAGLIVTIIPFAAALFSSAVAAERWVRLISDNEGSIYIDANSIRGRGRYRYYWQQAVLRNPRPVALGVSRTRVPVYGFMIYSSVDCRSKITRYRRVIWLDRNNRAIIEANINNYGPLESIRRTRSPALYAADYACARRR
jgi:hypothetical protein